MSFEAENPLILSQEISEEKKPVKLSPLTKFRSVVRYVMKNVDWLHDLPTLVGDERKIRDFSIMVRSGPILDITEKLILIRDHKLRTKEENETVWRKLNQLKYIRKYPDRIQKKILECVYFLYLKKGRVILKEFRSVPPFGGMYIILRGEIQFLTLAKDQVTDEDVMVPFGVGKTGEGFGDSSILSPPRGTTAVVSSEYSELLFLNLDDFNQILRVYLSVHFEEIDNALNTLPHFKSWSENVKNKIKSVVDVKVFQKEDILIGYSVDNSSVGALFLLKGKCEIISALTVKKKKVGKSVTYFLHPNQDNFIPPTMTGETVFLRLCTLTPGIVFSLGENLTNKVIMSNTNNTRCLEIPLYLLQANNNGMIWNRARLFLDSIIPTTEEQFEWFCNSRKQMLAVKALLRNSIDPGTSGIDIPLSCRIDEIQPLELFSTEDLGELKEMPRIEKKVTLLMRKGTRNKRNVKEK